MEVTALVIAIIAGLASAASAVWAFYSWREAKKANRLVEAYRAPYFDLHIDPEPPGNWEGTPPLHLRLINRGDSFAKAVTFHAEADPTGLKIFKQKWDFIQAKSGRSFPIDYPGGNSASNEPYNWHYAGSQERNTGVVEWTSVAGTKETQKVRLPMHNSGAYETDLAKGNN